MEVNKDEAERCKVIGTNALKQKQYERAAKFFKKSLSLYPLPGVDVFLSTAERLASNENQDNENDANQSSNFTRSTSTASSSTATTTPTSPGGRAYTEAQVQIVETILQAKATGGRTAHYKVLQLSSTNPTEAEIKKAYRKLAIKVHPDKNSAPKADEAFKAVGLAYATLSDPQKKVIYDQSGEEDPDNRGGGGGMRRHGGMHFRPGDEVSPEDIFNMFFGGGMPGGMGGSMHRGPGGMHFYSNFGGGGMNGFARAHQQQQQRRRAPAGQAQRPQNDDAPPGLASMMQLLPFLLILALSFFNMNDGTGMGSAGGTASPGLDRYFSLTVSPA
jgi:DnaJ family protein B protein 12